MPVNWKDPEAFSRLLAAMVAAQDMKLDYRKIATMYGKGATYDSVEGRFRIIKKEAAALKAEIDNGTRPAAPARGATSMLSTPKKSKSTSDTPKKDKVVGHRITKNKATPTKKRGSANSGIKEELDDSSTSFMDLTATQEDEDFAADIEGGLASLASQGDVGGDDSNLYGDYVDEGMDVEAF